MDLSGNKISYFKHLVVKTMPFGAGFLAAAAIGWILWPQILYKTQPEAFSFNHLAHVDKAAISCQACHSFGSDGRFSGLPDAKSCIKCHNWKQRQDFNNPKETEFLIRFVNPVDQSLKQELRWTANLGLPDHVYFSHLSHHKIGLTCDSCHQDVVKSTDSKKVSKNRITGYSLEVTKQWKMNDCMECHAKNGRAVSNSCFTCHK